MGLPNTSTILATHDDRGDGWMLYRYDDCPLVDFTKIKEHPDITFAHKGGFIAKTLSLQDSVKELINLSIN